MELPFLWLTFFQWNIPFDEPLYVVLMVLSPQSPFPVDENFIHFPQYLYRWNHYLRWVFFEVCRHILSSMAPLFWWDIIGLIDFIWTLLSYRLLLYHGINENVLLSISGYSTDNYLKWMLIRRHHLSSFKISCFHRYLCFDETIAIIHEPCGFTDLLIFIKIFIILKGLLLGLTLT